ncbi:hypothetical protein [Nocardia gamkensis]|uniref:hypothetical protein n=1 Tax=Nocardia gamkensis TaxID=352869 RepID=UPI0037CCBE4A
MDLTARAMLERWRARVRATRARRFVVGLLGTLLVLLPVWTISGGPAAGSADSVAYPTSPQTIDGLSWTGITDSDGVPLSSYMFATDASLFNPLGGVSIVLGLLFGIFMDVVISGIWLTVFVANFGWLDWLGKPFTALASSLTHTIATPLMLTGAVTIGAVFVAWFIVRGYPAKAVVQVVAMLLVAVSGATFLADPMAGVLSSDGLLAQGRDVGISVAAGLNGQSTPDPQSIVKNFSTTLADNFARHPVQLWNLGHSVDTVPACRAAWSSAVLAGSESQLLQGMRQCGDVSARKKIENPSFGQIGTGVVLLIFGSILMLFLSYLSIKIFLAAVSSIFHAILAIFGFAAGGFIYGPTQTFLVRNLVGMVGDAFSLVVLFVFEGGFILVLDSLVRAAPDSGIAVIFVAGILLIAGFVLLRRLDLNLIGGQSRMAEKIRAVLEGRPAPAVVGDTTGQGTLRYVLSPDHAIGSGLNFLGNVNMSPVASWAFRRPNPLTFGSSKSWDMTNKNYELLHGRVPPGTEGSLGGRSSLLAGQYDDAVLQATKIPGFEGFNARSAAAAITSVRALGGSVADGMSAMAAVSARSPGGGWRREQITRAGRVATHLKAGAEDNPAMYGPLANTAAALDLADIYGNSPGEKGMAYYARAAEEAALFAHNARPPSNSHHPYGNNALVQAVMRDYKTYADFERAVGHIGRMGSKQTGPINRSDAIRAFSVADEDTRLHIGNKLAQDLAEAVNNVLADPKNSTLKRAAMDIKARAMHIDRLLSGTNIGPWTN